MANLNVPTSATNIGGQMVINMSLSSSGQLGQVLYQRLSGAGFGNNTGQISNVSGATLVTSDYLPLTSTPTVLTVPSDATLSTQVTGTMLTSNIATYFGANTYLPGQLVTVVNSTNGSTFNVTAQPILRATSTYFTVSVTHADILYASEVGSGATLSPCTASVASGISMLYVQNLSADQCVVVSWTPFGGSNETVVTLSPAAVLALAFPGNGLTSAGSPVPGAPSGNSGITAIKVAAVANANSIPAQIVNDGISKNIATFITAAAHGFSVGQLVTTSGLSNASGAFNITSQPILSVSQSGNGQPINVFTVGIVHADVNAAADVGDAIAIVPADSACAYAILA